MHRALEKAGGIDVDVEHFMLVTHEVPAQRVRAHLPAIYELETFVASNGDQKALVSATCFCNRSFRPHISPLPRLSFNESTYRTYVRVGGKKGVYFFGRYLGHPVAACAQRLFARHTYLGNFDVSVEETDNGYPNYSCRVSSDSGETFFSARAVEEPAPKPPFDTGDELAQFITYRLHGYFTSSAGAQGHMPVSHKRMSPFSGSLVEAPRFDLWERLEVLSPEEASDPYCLLVQRPLRFLLHPPRLANLSNGRDLA